MSFADDNAAYETWLAAQCDVVAEDLEYKHWKMSRDPFNFLRATYFRWAKTIGEICPDAMDAPVALCVADGHLENFGTWRDDEGRLVWGVNDFDEAYDMPYVLDLVRLAASALLAPAIKLRDREIARAIRDGYAAGLENPRPTLLDERQSWILPYVASSEEGAAKFWAKIEEYPKARPPRHVKDALLRSLPKGATQVRFASAVKGGGSLGRPRYMAVANFQGGNVVREAKALVPSAWSWAHRSRSRRIRFLQLARGRYRSPDPFLSIGNGFIFRRIAPDSRKLELGEPGAAELSADVLCAMGFDLAAIHAARDRGVAALKADLRERDDDWLCTAARMASRLVWQDWKSWVG